MTEKQNPNTPQPQVQSVINCYVAIQKGYVGEKDLPSWDELPNPERQRLIDACRKALQADPGVSLMEVMETQMKDPNTNMPQPQVQSVINCYVAIQEGYVGGEDLAGWDELPNPERQHLIDACRKALQADPGVNLMEVMEAQVNR